MEKHDEIEFDLIQMARFLLKKVWIVVLAAVIFFGIGYIGGKLLITPEYTASCRIYVYQGKEMSVTDLQIATQLCNDCEIMITGQNVTKPVVERLGLEMTPGALGRRIKVTSEDNTRILQLEYTDTDPQRAADVLNEICAEAAVQIKEYMKVEAVTTLYEAEAPKLPSNPGAGRYALLAAVAGAVLAVAVLIVVFLMDDTIRNEEDVQRFLGLSTLGAVPSCGELGMARKFNETSKSKHSARFSKK